MKKTSVIIGGKYKVQDQKMTVFFRQYLTNKAPTSRSVSLLDSISLVVVIVVSNKPSQRLDLHRFKDEIISLMSSFMYMWTAWRGME